MAHPDIGAREVKDVDLTILLDQSSSTVLYMGFAQPGSDTVSGKADARWRIKKIDTTTSTNQKITTWADGNSLYDNVWNDRATLTYS